MTPTSQTLARTIASIAFAAVVACVNGSGVETASRPADLVLLDVTVFDPRDRVALVGRTVVVEDGRILAVLAAGASVPEARRTIQGRGRLLTPGLVDVHSHVA